MTEALDSVIDRVRERILSGRLGAEAPVRQDALAGELGVSKIPLREALSRLEAEGLVQAHRHRGYVVRPLSPAEAEDVFDLRLKLEPAAAALGARLAGPDDWQAAEEALMALTRAAEAGGADVGRRNREFHLALVRPSARAVTLQTLERLLTISERYVRVHLGPQGRSDHARRDHEALLDAWVNRREATVRGHMERHIEATLMDLRRQL